MRYLKMAVFGVISLLIVILVIAFILPSSGHVEREGVIYAPPAVIFEQLNDLRNTVKWNPWNQAALNETTHFSVPPKGNGAWYSWEGAGKNTSGKYVLTGSTPDSSVQFLWYNDRLPPIRGGFLIRATKDGKGCWVKWYMDLPAGWRPWLRFYAVMMDKLAGPDLEAGLTNLKVICEENAAQGSLPLSVSETTINVRFIATMSDTVTTGRVPESLNRQYDLITEFIRDHHLEVSGNRIAQFLDLGKGMQQVNAGIPVNRSIATEGRIRILRMPHGNVLLARYKGPYSGVKKAYQAIRDYISDNAKQSPAGPWEEYVRDSTSTPDSTQWETDVYWPVY